MYGIPASCNMPILGIGVSKSAFNEKEKGTSTRLSSGVASKRRLSSRLMPPDSAVLEDRLESKAGTPSKPDREAGSMLKRSRHLSRRSRVWS